MTCYIFKTLDPLQFNQCIYISWNWFLLIFKTLSLHNTEYLYIFSNKAVILSIYEKCVKIIFGTLNIVANEP